MTKYYLTIGKKIIEAKGPSYVKFNTNIKNFIIKKWWFAGKYIYVLINKKNKKFSYTHTFYDVW